MIINNFDLEHIINNELNSNSFTDYVPNGLQVEGRSEIRKIITGVTACQELLQKAIQLAADAIIVHHGFFWKNELPYIRGIKKTRLSLLLCNNINLYSWHLPLDVHPKLGNNIQLAKKLNIHYKGAISNLVLWGELPKPYKVNDFIYHVMQKIGRTPTYFGNNVSLIKNIAWCCGSGQKFIDLVTNYRIDAFCSGEISEQTFHIAKENNLHYFAIGHHASECWGIEALGNWLSEQYNLEVIFINIPNPA